MIRCITGLVQSTNIRSLVITTTSGLGYLVYIPSRSSYQAHHQVTLHTHLAVRETSLDLYGFDSIIELQWFELLLTIPKIGPKSALQILDVATPELLASTISQNDAGQLAKLSGLGKKTAEKIVLALAEKIPPDLAVVTPMAHTPFFQDAFDTLVTLGYNPSDVRSVLDTLTEHTSTSALVTHALKRL